VDGPDDVIKAEDAVLREAQASELVENDGVEDLSGSNIVAS
jgi:hypothetical protein